MSLRRTALRALSAAAVVAAVAAPSAAAAERIPASIGKQASDSFLIGTRSLPANVPLDRFARVARDSGARWGLRARAYTTRPSGYRDGYDVVGFGTNVPEEALAVQRDYVVRLYRLRKRCRLRAGRRRACRTVSRRYAGQKVVERDVTVRPDVLWQPGPGYPGAEEWDLETTLVHELGHFAGNRSHVRRCSNSPLMESLGPGEWWRSTADWHVEGCAPAVIARAGAVRSRARALRPRAARRTRRAQRALAHERVIVGSARVR